MTRKPPWIPCRIQGGFLVILLIVIRIRNCPRCGLSRSLHKVLRFRFVMTFRWNTALERQ
ncbi:DUF2752 domain-containing protein [Bifidobacterium reuteri]|uniref:DUF2752 domain-containing protein n=1 Tax=Bifidobacterium reuteri TaxID=983706 RepID=A0A5J5EAN8_9BIFI|nr:DUF2752 domain-containing protein [Bifidobacterium reuteri]